MEKRVQATVPALLKLAWPIVVSRATQAVIGIADALMVAHLGQSALAAVTTGSMNALALFILPVGTIFIVGSFSSQYFGKGDLAGARRFAYYGLIIAGLTQLGCLLILPLMGEILPQFGFEPEVLQLMDDYLSIRLLSGGAVVAVDALAGYYGGLGNTRLPMLANLVAMVCNLFGNWLLIDGRWGFPALGVTGAAWASILSSTVAAGGLMAVFIAHGLRDQQLWLKLYRSEFWRTLRFGLPSGLNWFLEFFAFIFFVNVVVAGLGTAKLAAFMAVMQINSVSFMPAFAIASAGAIIVGQAIGAGAHREVPRTVTLTFLVAAGWQLLVGASYLVIPTVIFEPFAQGTEAATLLLLGAGMLRLSSVWQLFDSIATTISEALRAAGDTAFTLWARVGLAWLAFVPGTYLTIRRWEGTEVTAMWWLTGYLAALALVLFLRFRHGAWRRIELHQAPLQLEKAS